MTIEFTKMHGLGNDFMVIDAINQTIDLSTEQIQRLANRHLGIGFDQLLLVESPQTAAAEFCYRIFNADGGEVEQCGNGARCFAVFVRERGLTSNNTIPVETAGGLIYLTVEANGEITVDMGVPDFNPQSLPFLVDAEVLPVGRMGDEVDHYDLALNGEKYALAVVSVGNPHAVLQVDAVATVAVAEIGAMIGRDSHFPQGVNVGFMQILNRQSLCLRVFERGAGETLACGTGACAAAAVGIHHELLDNEVKVQLHGGVLTIRWAGQGCSLFMTGPATRVYKGQISL